MSSGEPRHGAGPIRDRFTLGTDGTIRFTSQNVLHVVNKDGSVKWTFEANDSIVSYKEGLGGTVHVITQSGAFGSPENTTLFALNGSDGSMQWQHLSKEVQMWYENMAITDRTIYLQRTDAGIRNPQGTPRMTYNMFLEAIDIAGTVRWAKHFDSSGESHTLLGRADGGVLMGDEKTLRALSSEDGSIDWKFETAHNGPRPLMDMHHVVSKDGSVFVTQSTTTQFAPPKVGYELNLLRLGGQDGGVLWNVSLGYSSQRVRFLLGARAAPFIGSNGAVYVGGTTDEDGVCNFHAFDFDSNPLPTLPFCDCDNVLTNENEDGTEEDVFFDEFDAGEEHTGMIAYSSAGRVIWNSTYLIRNGSPFETVFGPDGKLFPFFFVKEAYSPTSPHGYQYTATAIRNVNETSNVQHVASFDLLMAEDGTTYNLVKKVTYLHSSTFLVALDTGGAQKWIYTAETPLFV